MCVCVFVFFTSLIIFFATAPSTTTGSLTDQGMTCGTYQKLHFGWDACAVAGGLCLLIVLVVYATCVDLINVSANAL